MKAGLAMAFHALAGLDDRDGVTLLVTGDEELGSPSSRGADRGRGPGAEAAWCSRPRRRRGAEDRAQGRLPVRRAAARPGGARRLEPELGVNATVELAHQVLAVAALASTSPARP
jgi:glutamate carboxypeptidase